MLTGLQSLSQLKQTIQRLIPETRYIMEIRHNVRLKPLFQQHHSQNLSMRTIPRIIPNPKSGNLTPLKAVNRSEPGEVRRSRSSSVLRLIHFLLRFLARLRRRFSSCYLY